MVNIFTTTTMYEKQAIGSVLRQLFLFAYRCQKGQGKGKSTVDENTHSKLEMANGDDNNKR